MLVYPLETAEEELVLHNSVLHTLSVHRFHLTMDLHKPFAAALDILDLPMGLRMREERAHLFFGEWP
jgi:hypothetical protein